MAALSVVGERSILALLADQYAEIVELREALANERDAHAVTRADLDQLRTTVLADALGPEDPPPA